MMLSSSRRPSASVSSATARAAGTTWIAGWPPPSRLPAAGHHRADRVEQHQARGLDRLVRQAVETHRRDELREAVEIIHGERVRPYPAVPPMGATGPVRARNCP